MKKDYDLFCLNSIKNTRKSTVLIVLQVHMVKSLRISVPDVQGMSAVTAWFGFLQHGGVHWPYAERYCGALL